MSNFWGLHLTKGLRYTKIVKKPFRVAAAVLDTKSCVRDEVISVLFEQDDMEYVLCNLSIEHNILQCPLDLHFCEGDTICFSLRGGVGDVVLTGYNLEIEEDFDFDEEDEEDEEEEEQEAPQLVKMKRKREAIEEKGKSPKKDPKKLKVENGGPTPLLALAAAPDSGKKLSKRERKKLNRSLLNSTAESNASGTQASPAPKKKDNKKPNGDVSMRLEDLLNGSEYVEDEDDADFTMEGIEIDTDEDSSDEGEEEEDEDESGEEEDSDDDDEEEEDSDEEEEEKTKMSPPKKSAPGTPSSAGRTPMPKKQKNQEKKLSLTPKERRGPMIVVVEKNRTPKAEEPVKTPKSKRKKNKSGEKTPNEKAEPKTPESEGKKAIKQGGVVCEDLALGSGSEAKTGKMISVYYQGKLKNGKCFDKITSGKGFRFRLGANEVIKGWDVGVQGMKVGGKRRIVAPPNMAYGKAGAPPSIPPNSFLVFDVELRAVN